MDIRITALLTVASLLQVDASWLRPRQATPEGAVRLVGGATEYEGRVEVFHDDQWGTVCDDWWDSSEAAVVCHYLGYRGGTARYKGFFGAGWGPIHLDTIDCDGDEANLALCAHAPWGEHDCSHMEDAGVVCSAP